MRVFMSIVGISLLLVCAGRASAQALPPPVSLPSPVALDVPSQDDDADAEETPFGDATLGPAGRIGVGASLDLLWYLDRAHEAFASTPGSTAGGFFASLTIFEVAPRWLLDVGVGWRIEASKAPLLQSVTASYESNTEYVDAALRFEVTPWLLPRARVSVGAEYLAVTLAPDDGTTPLEGGAFSFVTSAGAGVELLARVGDGVTSRRGETAAVALSLVVEGGVALGTNTTLTVKPREPSDSAAAADLLPVVGTKLGSLGGVAPYLRIAGVIRF